jgi:hypothetical protein
VIASVKKPVRRCLDPFGGSGTTPLTAQLLGVHPTTIEVNPFLADLIEAKLASYDRSLLLDDRLKVAERCAVAEFTACGGAEFQGAPRTFVEPGISDRWIFDGGVARRIHQFREAIESVEDEANRRLFRVLLGSILVTVSNVTISGKGRRYRQNWQQRRHSASDVDDLFDQAFLSAYLDICSYPERRCAQYRLLRGDCRVCIPEVDPVDLVLFSPPYPNSFDYTDIYNVELWALGYLESSRDNRTLREATLRSHVQIKRTFAEQDLGSKRLARTLAALRDARADLWNQNIPAMVAAYFEDIAAVLQATRDRLTAGGEIVMVVGDSRYADITVEVPAIVEELVEDLGLVCREVREVRSMRSSPQHGGAFTLRESLIRLSLA